jgi:ASC-1-like (ASCH) protein
MSDFPSDKIILTGTTDAQRVTDVQVTATFKSVLRRQEALEHIQKAIEACTTPTVRLSLAQIDTKINSLT